MVNESISIVREIEHVDDSNVDQESHVRQPAQRLEEWMG